MASIVTVIAILTAFLVIGMGTAQLVERGFWRRLREPRDLDHRAEA